MDSKCDYCADVNDELSFGASLIDYSDMNTTARERTVVFARGTGGTIV